MEPELVERHLPGGLSPDVHQGAAYVGLVPFRMGEIRVALGSGRGLALPQGSFPETNVRTYVIGPDGGRGVYFHSLDITRLTPALVARLAYQLPYAWSRMRIGRDGARLAYAALRRWPAPAGARSRLRLEVGDALVDADVTELDVFLSSRWSLYAASPRGTIVRAHVEHPAWPLQGARLERLDDELVAAAGYGELAEREPDHVRYGGDVVVRVGAPRRVGS